MPLRFLMILFLLAATGLAEAQTAKSAPARSAADKRFGELMSDVRSLASAQQHEQALEMLREADALKPNSPEVQTARGNVYASAKQYDKARECFMKAEAL